MHHTSRLLARYLEPGVSTGLTGLRTHAAPRSALLSIYTTILAKLQRFPESSLYRQSIESLTQHRLSLVQRIVPAGYEEWTIKMRQVVSENPGYILPPDQASKNRRTFFLGGQTYTIPKRRAEKDIREEEWNGESDTSPLSEGQRAADEKIDLVSKRDEDTLPPTLQAQLSTEPQLTAVQIAELEDSIGAGLLEEVIQVAEGELKLLDVMYEAKVWEPLCEKAAPGQWSYFDRSSK